jgi:hypothetical protein
VINIVQKSLLFLTDETKSKKFKNLRDTLLLTAVSQTKRHMRTSLGHLKAIRDHQLTAGYRPQLKARVQMSGETLQAFAAAVEPLAQRALFGLRVDFIRKVAANAFVDGLRDGEVKRHFMMGGDMTLRGALSQTLKL